MMQLFNQEFVLMCGTAAAYRAGHTLRVWSGEPTWLALMGLKVRDDQKEKGNKNKTGKRIKLSSDYTWWSVL